LTLAVQALTRPGDVVLVEQPTYIGFLNIMKLHGLQPVAVPMDEHGVRLDQLERIVAQHRPRIFYTVATFQNPTGATISLERRQALLRLARQHGFTIIEDDLYAPLAFDAPPPPTIKSLDDGGHVLYLTSFSKALAPGLRMGVMVPPAALYERMLALKLGADCGSPLLLQRALAHFLREGHYRRHLRRVIPIYRERRGRGAGDPGHPSAAGSSRYTPGRRSLHLDHLAGTPGHGRCAPAHAGRGLGADSRQRFLDPAQRPPLPAAELRHVAGRSAAPGHSVVGPHRARTDAGRSGARRRPGGVGTRCLKRYLPGGLSHAVV
jgi:hypothetical protein